MPLRLVNYYPIPYRLTSLLHPMSVIWCWMDPLMNPCPADAKSGSYLCNGLSVALLVTHVLKP